MEDNQTGVTESAEAPQVSAGEASPTSIDTGDNQATEGNDSQVAQAEEQAKSKEYNFQQMRKQMQAKDAQIKQLENASKLDAWIRQNPKNLQVIEAMLAGKDPFQDQVAQAAQAPTEDRWKDYAPEIAESMRELERLKKWQGEFEKTQQQKEQQSQQAQMQSNMQSLDQAFDQNMIKDGFMTEARDGDMKMINLIQRAMLAELAAQVGDPRTATIEQFQAAYKEVVEGLSAHQKFTLKKTVKAPGVPQTGSRQGQAATGRPAQTAKDRIADIASEIASWNS